MMLEFYKYLLTERLGPILTLKWPRGIRKNENRTYNDDT